MYQNIKVIGFDADDTLWVNEPYFQATETAFCRLLQDWLPAEAVSRELFHTEMQNLEPYGFGAKAYVLSLIETALRITKNQVNPTVIDSIIQLGKELIQKPIELLDGVEQVLQTLYGKYKLIVATKGDLLDQERKLKKSGLERFFHHIEIMSDKQETDYRKLLTHLDILPSQFLMVGNSLKSDILPVIQIGGKAIHVPYHVTWQHELNISAGLQDQAYREAASLKEILEMLADEKN